MPTEKMIAIEFFKSFKKIWLHHIPEKTEQKMMSATEEIYSFERIFKATIKEI